MATVWQLKEGWLSECLDERCGVRVEFALPHLPFRTRQLPKYEAVLYVPLLGDGRMKERREEVACSVVMFFNERG